MFRTLIPKTNIDFVSKRYYAFAFSGIMVTLGLVSFGIILFGQANLSIDFSGGTLVQGAFANNVEVGVLRAAVDKQGFEGTSIQHLFGGRPNSFMIRVETSGMESGEQSMADRITKALATEFPDNPFTLESVHEVGPTVGKELQTQAIRAIVIALVGILIYVWVRFDFRFSTAATVATFHDVLATLGFMFLLQREISLLVVTALLTLAGYSLTDTVVIFDRIRENLKTFRKKGDFVATVNASINEVLSRSVITSVTVLFSAIVLLVVGGTVVRDFALALTFGLFIGSYSSIFVASPMIVEWEARSPKRFKA